MHMRLFFAGWLLFLSAFFLPAGEGLVGWEAFVFSLQDGFPSYPFFSALTNIFMLVTLLMLAKKDLARLLSVFVLLAAAVNLYWVLGLIVDGSLGDLSFGYYLWCLSFFIVGGALWRMAPGKQVEEAEVPGQ